MRAADVMVRNPHVAVASATATEVAIMLRDRNISVIPVVDDHRNRRLLGTLSDRDIVTRCIAATLHPMHTRADQLVRVHTPIVSEDQELDGFQLRLDEDPHESHMRPTITVVDDNGCVVGFISHPEQIPGIQIVGG